jgi:hypothetical protein
MASRAAAAPLTDLPMAEAKRPAWQVSQGTYIAGRSHLDGLDQLAADMEAKWGCDRLRLIVSAELREKFDRQRVKLRHAVEHGDIEDVSREATRMSKAWVALDKAATEAGAAHLHASVVEIPLADGTVAALVPTTAEAIHIRAEGRKTAIFSYDEIGRILSGWPEVVKAKIQMPAGAVVTAVRRNVEDSIQDMDMEIPF